VVVGGALLTLATVGLGTSDSFGAAACSARAMTSCTLRGCDEVGVLSAALRCTAVIGGALLTLATVGLGTSDSFGAADCSARAIASCTVRGCDEVGVLSAALRCTVVVGDGLLLATLGLVVLDSFGAADCSARTIASCTVRGCDEVGVLSAALRCTAVADGELLLETVGLGVLDSLGAVDCSARAIASCTVRGCDDVGVLSAARRCILVVGGGVLLATVGLFVLDSFGAADCSARAMASCTLRVCAEVGALSAGRRCTAVVGGGVVLATVGLGAFDSLGAADCSVRAMASCTLRGCDDVGVLSAARRCTADTDGALLTLATLGLGAFDSLGAADCSARAMASPSPD